MAKLFDFQAESLPSWWDGNYMNQGANLNLIKGDGASQVVLVPTVYMDSLTSTRVYRDNGDVGGHNVDGAPRTESDASIKAAINAAQTRGLEVIFKLHVNMQNDDWNALIGPPAGSTPAQAKVWADAWFASYKEAVIHYAKLAKEEGVTAFAIGNECESMTKPEYTEYWRGIIAAVRDELGPDSTMQLTYAATWTEALHVEFWNDLDYIGANPYIAFTENNPNPTVQQLVDGWTKPNQASSTTAAIGANISAMDALKQVAQQFGKKLIFTETGFRSMNLNNTHPWEWGDGNFIDEPEQLNMFKAFYKIITDRADEGWMGGYWLWNYDANQPNEAPDTGYYTHGKPSDALVEQYFKDPKPVAGLKLDGTTSGDTLVGGFNHDTIVGGAGNDTLTGNRGGDLFVYAGGDGADTITDFRSTQQGDKIRLINVGAAGFDDLQIVQTNGGYLVRFPDGGSLTILTADGNPKAEWFTFTAEAGPSIKPTSGDDSITGTSKANTINALAGDDTILGLGGSDRLRGDLGNDTIDGGTGDDVIYGDKGDDYLEGGSGADRIYGGENGDIISGGTENDQLRGDSGDDMLNGDAGNDLIRGGTGYDVLNGDVGHDKLYGEADNDQLSGGEGNDLINGGDGNDNVEGDDGDDKLYGGNGNDVVDGWFGNDQLWGGAGDDVIVAGGGTDKIWGGKGADDFVFGNGVGKDVIYDFKLKQGDQLIIQGDMNGTGIGSGNTDAEVMQKFMKLVKQAGRDTVINFGDGDVLTLKNFKASTLHRDDIWFW